MENFPGSYEKHMDFSTQESQHVARLESGQINTLVLASVYFFVILT